MAEKENRAGKSRAARIRNCLPTRRKLIQLYAALLYNAHLKGFISGEIYTGKLKSLCVPGLNCYSCPGAVGACPLGALQNAVASSGKRFPGYVLGILLLYGLIAGRTICGWLCPFGFLQELLFLLPTPKLKKSRVTRVLSYLKYVILFVFVGLIPFVFRNTLPLPAFCKYICPAGTFEGALALMANARNADKLGMLGTLFTQKFVIMIAIGLACVFIFRSFCRFLCPLGAVYGFFSRITLIGIKVDRPACTGCSACVAACPMDIRTVGDHECIHCGACISACPAGAISFCAGKKKLFTKDAGTGGEIQAERKNEPAVRSEMVACLLLAAVLIAVNVPWKAAKTPNLPAGEVIPAEGSTEPPAGGMAPGEDPSEGSARESEQSEELVPGDGQADGKPSAEMPSSDKQPAAEVPSSDKQPSAEVPSSVEQSAAEEPSTVEEPSETEVESGHGPGQKAADFSLECINGSTFSLSAQRGKVVVINLWATWCGPCVKELPYFEELYAGETEKVAVLAIHSDLITDDVEEWLSEHDYTMPFAIDYGGEVIASLGGSTMLPQTIILDQNGVVAYNAVGSMTEEKLKGLVEPLY